MIRLLLASIVAAASVQSAWAAEDSLTAASIEAAADAQFANPLESLGVAGVSVAVVKDGAVWSKGYGRADIVSGEAMSGDTVLHIASVTKVVTAVAVLQLAEAGNLSLDDRARDHVPLAVGARLPEDIRVRDLLTHTSGLGEDYLGVAATSPSAIGPLDEFLARRLPAPVLPPRTGILYSNFNYAVLGAIIEHVSGVPYADYVEREIFAPLGMTRTAVNSSAKGASLKRAPGYFYRAKITPEPEVFERIAPAGAILSTANDLARLLAALMQAGSAPQILSTQSAQSMLSNQWSAGPGLAGRGFGFWEIPHAAEPAYATGGEAPGYSARILVLPARKLAVIVLANRKDPLPAIAFFDKLLPVAAPSSTSAGDSRALSAFGGEYRYPRYPHGNFLKVAALFMPSIKVAPSAQGADLRFANYDRAPETWRAAGDGVIASPDGNLRAKFEMSNGKALLQFYDPSSGPGTFIRVPSLLGSEVQGTIVLGVLAIMLLHVLSGLLAAVLRAVTGKRDQTNTKSARFLGAAGSVALLLGFAIFAYGIYALAIAAGDRFAFGAPGWLKVSFYLIWAGLAIGLLHLVSLVRASGGLSWFKLRHALLAVSFAIFAAWAAYSRLLDGPFQF